MTWRTFGAVGGAGGAVIMARTTRTCFTRVGYWLSSSFPTWPRWSVPLGLGVNYTLPKLTTLYNFRRLLDGVDACTAAHRTKVVGGDLRDGDTIELSAAAVGQCMAGTRLGRTGASIGDRLLVGSAGYLWASALLVSGQATLSGYDTQAI